MKKDIIKPIAVLVSICFVVAAALAVINFVTAPIIKTAEENAAKEAMFEVLEADSYTELSDVKLPEAVDEKISEIYKADDKGYVFMLTTKGYGGEMKLICGINNDGTISACQTLNHNETSGLGSKTADEPYRTQYDGKSADTLSEVDAITGATISSNAYMSAIEAAFDAFEIVKEAE